MIELNGIYKLKLIRNIKCNDTSDYQVIEFSEKDIVICKKLNGEDAGKLYCFMKDFLIDPDKPDDIYSNITVERG